MAPKALAAAFGLIIMTSPVAASTVEPVSNAPAPAGTPQTQYCLRVGPVTGNIAEIVQCWTRDEWADQGVDVDKEWSKEGVRVIG
jgi:hypothetical protein